MRSRNAEYWFGRVVKEYARASEIYPPFRSAHEGYAILLEEMNELWDALRVKPWSVEKIEKEAVHVAAVALRFLVDGCVPSVEVKNREEQRSVEGAT